MFNDYCVQLDASFRGLQRRRSSQDKTFCGAAVTLSRIEMLDRFERIEDLTASVNGVDLSGCFNVK
jgi:hypothetical protein